MFLLSGESEQNVLREPPTTRAPYPASTTNRHPSIFPNIWMIVDLNFRILVRKRDKLSDKRKSTQAIDKYMTGARRYFTKLEELLPSVTRRVFIATDDRNVVKLVRKRYAQIVN